MIIEVFVEYREDWKILEIICERISSSGTAPPIVFEPNDDPEVDSFMIQVPEERWEAFSYRFGFWLKKQVAFP